MPQKPSTPAIAKPSRYTDRCVQCLMPFEPSRPKTKDHVVPKGFFSRGTTVQLVTAPTCRPCQERFHPHEERIRNALVPASAAAPTAFAHALGAAERSACQPDRHDRWLRTGAGLCIPAQTVESLQADLDVVFAKITRGLYFHVHGNVMPAVPLRVGLLTEHQVAVLTDTLLGRCGAGVRRLGHEFWWSYANLPGAPEDGIWLHMAFQAVVVGVWTGRAVEFGDLPFARGVIVGGHPDAPGAPPPDARNPADATPESET